MDENKVDLENKETTGTEESSNEEQVNSSVVSPELFNTVKDNSLPGDTNTFVPLEMNDGSTVYLTCTFLRIYKIKSVNPEFYKRYNSIIMNGPESVLDIVTSLYGAYLCAHINTVESCMSEEEFMAKVPYNFNYIREVNNKLTYKKKN